MKLLLDMYRSAPKEQRDKVQLMAAEKKYNSEVINSAHYRSPTHRYVWLETWVFIRFYTQLHFSFQGEELRQRLRELEERERREGKKMADEEALRKIRSVEEQIDILNKKLSIAKQVLWSTYICLLSTKLAFGSLAPVSPRVPPQEEDALLSEMDVTGQAFEDMQEQNIRLMQQLREKDDANFKLMSERIKSNQIHKLLKEEKEELADQLLTLKTQVSNGDRTHSYDYLQWLGPFCEWTDFSRTTL